MPNSNDWGVCCKFLTVSQLCWKQKKFNKQINQQKLIDITTHYYLCR